MKTLILSDFSKTITSGNNPTTWSVFAKSWLLWEQYILDRDEFYRQNYHYEVEWNVGKTCEWFAEHLKLFAKYGLTEELIHKIVRDNRYFEPRDWIAEFFEGMKEVNADFIIVSSWIVNFIDAFFEYYNIECGFKVIWNNLDISNGEVVWHSDLVICPLNKYDHGLNLWEYDKIIILWDDESDLKMYEWNNVIKIWFCDKNKPWFDFYLWKEGSLVKVLGKIKEII